MDEGVIRDLHSIMGNDPSIQVRDHKLGQVEEAVHHRHLPGDEEVDLGLLLDEDIFQKLNDS